MASNMRSYKTYGYHVYVHRKYLTEHFYDNVYFDKLNDAKIYFYVLVEKEKYRNICPNHPKVNTIQKIPLIEIFLKDTDKKIISKYGNGTITDNLFDN